MPTGLESPEITDRFCKPSPERVLEKASGLEVSDALLHMLCKPSLEQVLGMVTGLRLTGFLSLSGADCGCSCG
jgi:hypothetical protein